MYEILGGLVTAVIFFMVFLLGAAVALEATEFTQEDFDNATELCEHHEGFKLLTYSEVMCNNGLILTVGR